MRGTGGPFDPDALLADFRLYDRSVDVVSAYHWLFTETSELPATVAHFERYPRIHHSDGRDASPDFSVLFNNNTALVAEIANIALRDESVDHLCSQLQRYDSLTVVPGPGGRAVDVDHVDVMFLSPMETAADAARRVFTERLDSADHSYSPKRRPTLVQFAATPDKYVFQFWPDGSLTGTITAGMDPVYSNQTFPTLNISPDKFKDNKIRYAFMNDPVKPLYLATRLWTSVFPSRFWVMDKRNEFTAEPGEIAKVVKELYGRGRTDDVKAALEVLGAAGLAVQHSKQWVVTRRNLKSDGDTVQDAIANRIARPPRRLIRSRAALARVPGEGQGALF